ncbi:hypothetical protein [Kribbella catacumbae]|uniref:hypothetical protein n=1 Tax=Kribbella catacumbae TaxID=460086 RepID=UPI001469FFE1|nr:hypothetical protein [Kribbella catacumbae]
MAVLGGGGLALAGRYLWDRRASGRLDAEELEQIRVLADEDVTLLGEELSRLGDRVAIQELDADTRLDYQRALDAYESAQRTVKNIRSAEEISTITDTLAAGRYAIICVVARRSGEPVPERRVPCFFNPQHGPSVTDVVWTWPGRGTRTVPACAQDAARVKANDDPEIRYVRYGSRRVPYWEAGAAVAPYGQGYFTEGVGATFIAMAAFEAQTGVSGSWGGSEAGFTPGGHEGGFEGGGGDGGGGGGGGGGDG